MSPDDPTAKRAHSTLSSVRNAARLLKEFGGPDRELGVTELSRRLGIGKSTAHRLLNTLAEERLLEQDPDTGLYRLALTMHELGASVQAATDLHTAASPVLDQLRNMTKETIQVAVLDGRHVVYIERRESPQTIRLFGRVGHRNHAYCTSTGKVLLAFLPPAELDAFEASDDHHPDFDESDRFLAVPSLGGRAAYQDMQDFVSAVNAPEAAERLAVAIAGRGAFRRFKYALRSYPDLEDDWHRFSDERRHGRARAWLAHAGYRSQQRLSSAPP